MMILTSLKQIHFHSALNRQEIALVSARGSLVSVWVWTQVQRVAVWIIMKKGVICPISVRYKKLAQELGVPVAFSFQIPTAQQNWYVWLKSSVKLKSRRLLSRSGRSSIRSTSHKAIAVVLNTKIPHRLRRLSVINLPAKSKVPYSPPVSIFYLYLA